MVCMLHFSLPFSPRFICRTSLRLSAVTRCSNTQSHSILARLRQDISAGKSSSLGTHGNNEGKLPKWKEHILSGELCGELQNKILPQDVVSFFSLENDNLDLPSNAWRAARDVSQRNEVLHQDSAINGVDESPKGQALEANNCIPPEYSLSLAKSRSTSLSNAIPDKLGNELNAVITVAKSEGDDISDSLSLCEPLPMLHAVDSEIIHVGTDSGSKAVMEKLDHSNQIDRQTSATSFEDVVETTSTQERGGNRARLKRLNFTAQSSEESTTSQAGAIITSINKHPLQKGGQRSQMRWKKNAVRGRNQNTPTPSNIGVEEFTDLDISSDFDDDTPVEAILRSIASPRKEHHRKLGPSLSDAQRSSTMLHDLGLVEESQDWETSLMPTASSYSLPNPPNIVLSIEDDERLKDGPLDSIPSTLSNISLHVTGPDSPEHAL